jgi:hypothetical protein
VVPFQNCVRQRRPVSKMAAITKNRNFFKWQSCLLMDQNEMSNVYRGPSIDASYQVSYHLAKRNQRKSCFRNQPIRNKNGLWWPCLLMDRDEIINLYRGPSIYASYQVSVHLAKRFQMRRLQCLKFTDN